MKCFKCGTEINDNVKFCTKCGSEVKKEETVKNDEVKCMDKNVSSKNFDLGSIVMNCLMFILNVILKPVSTLKEKLKDYSDFKSSGILVVFVSLGTMLINLLGSMISVVFYKGYSFKKGSTFNVDFGNLKNLDYFDLIVKQFIQFIIVVVAVAGIYYIVSLIFKKSANFFKLVTISAVSFIPFVIATGFVAVILNYIYIPLSLFVTLGALIYSLLTFVNAMDEELNIDDSTLKVYFHSICLTALFIVAYYVLFNEVTTSIGSMLK